jgi:hypothetical protein
MVEFSGIQASSPRTKPAEKQKTFDQWQMTQLLVQAEQPGGPIMADARFRAFRVLTDGSVEMAPAEDQYQTRMRVDLRQVADQDAGAKSVIDALLTTIESVGQAQGVL